MSEGTRRSLVFVGIIAIALMIWQIAGALVLAFVGILIAVFLRGLAGRLADRASLTEGWALSIVILTITVLLVGMAFLVGPRIVDQVQQLAESIPDSIGQLEESIRETDWGSYLLQERELPDGAGQLGSDVFSRLTGAAFSVVGGLFDLVLILFAAVFFALDPGLYKHGIVLLAPKRTESRLREALEASGVALWKWLMARFVAMLFVGLSVWIGLMLLGVPLALTLGLLAGLLDFVPFVGPIAAAVPAILLAFTMGPAEALYVSLLYLVVQQIEGNMVSPLVQQRAVSLPPVLVLFAVLAGGMLYGILGMLVATPLILIVIVFVSMLYIEDVLGKKVSIPGAD